MSHRPLVLAIVAGLLTLGVSPLTAAAHVNRTVGPYSFLLFMVEEPTFQDNHAGFEFWVRNGDVPLKGLETVLHAQAGGHGQVVDLVIDPIDASGFYVVDRSPDGTAFDPLGGGDWTLTLTGSVDATPISVDFPVRFPSYPRIGTPTSVVAQGTASSPSSTLVPPAAVLAGLAALVWLVVLRRQISQRRGR